MACDPAGGDCDDGDPEVSPDAPEVDDGIDNDCDGTVDPSADPEDSGTPPPETHDDPADEAPPGGCGCGAGPSPGAAVLLALLVIRRRGERNAAPA